MGTLTVPRSSPRDSSPANHRQPPRSTFRIRQSLRRFAHPSRPRRRGASNVAGRPCRLLAILLDNAVKYTTPPGAIELRLEIRNESVVITVRDSGIGIVQQDQRKIFERFYRVDKARSRDLGGVGIGLAIAEWIVEQHRGSIALQSSIGNGSSFTVFLPLQSKLAALVKRPESVVPAEETQT